MPTKRTTHCIWAGKRENSEKAWVHAEWKPVSQPNVRKCIGSKRSDKKMLRERWFKNFKETHLDLRGRDAYNIHKGLSIRFIATNGG